MGRSGSGISASTVVMIAAYELKNASNWWDQIDESPLWQDRIYHILTALFGIVSFVALVQLIWIQLRVPEYGWTTQKVFNFLNFVVNGDLSLKKMELQLSLEEKLLEQKAEFPEEMNSLLDRVP